MLPSNGLVLATAMAAGTAIFFAICLQKQPTTTTATAAVVRHPRPCISSDGKKKKKKKGKKKVKFAEDVMEPTGNGDEFRRRRLKSKNLHQNRNCLSIFKDEGGQMKLSRNFKGLPANRMALYSGILRDRGVHRVACSC